MTIENIVDTMIEVVETIGVDGVLEHVADACEVEADSAQSDADEKAWLALARALRWKARVAAGLYGDVALAKDDQDDL